MNRFSIIALLITALLVTACCKNKTATHANEDKPGSNLKPAQTNLNFTGSTLKDNYVWGGAMNMAWNELLDSFVKEKLSLDTNDEQTRVTLDKLNNPVFSKRDMDAESYFIKSGYGQATVDAINKECRAKFPNKSIADLQLKLGARDIISYAYFLKEIEYQLAFARNTLKFGDKEVQGFTADGNSYSNIYILEYKNRDNFLIGIRLKDEKDQIFLGKGYPMDNPDEAVKKLRELAPPQTDGDYTLGRPMNKKDVFRAPSISMEHTREYKEMLGHRVTNKALKNYVIGFMQEVLKFDMDERGARVENEALIGMVTSVGPTPDPYKPKELILDKPYWIMMKRSNSTNPYFLLGVNNTSFMKVKN